MSLRSCIPFLGKKTARQKIRELEKEAGSLPIIFGVFVTKIFENIVVWKPRLALNFSIAALVVGVVYVYGQEAKKAAKETAEKVEETVKEE